MAHLSKIRVDKVSYHRNGISGHGFHAVNFTAMEREMVGIVFEEPSYVAVFDRQMVGEGVTGDRNSWRGGFYEEDLREAIKQSRSA